MVKEINMKKNVKKSVILGLLFCCLFFVLLPQQMNAQVSSEAARLLSSANVQVSNQPTNPQNFTLPLLNGGSTSLSSHRGKVVLLNFWASWCPPCRFEKPTMEALYQRFNGQGLEILSVNLGEDVNTVRQFIQSNRNTFPVLLDSDGRISNMYNITGVPTTYIIDRRGLIIGKVNGGINWNTPQVIAAFEALLNSR